MACSTVCHAIFRSDPTCFVGFVSSGSAEKERKPSEADGERKEGFASSRGRVWLTCESLSLPRNCRLSLRTAGRTVCLGVYLCMFVAKLSMFVSLPTLFIYLFFVCTDQLVAGQQKTVGKTEEELKALLSNPDEDILLRYSNFLRQSATCFSSFQLFLVLRAPPCSVLSIEPARRTRVGMVWRLGRKLARDVHWGDPLTLTLVLGLFRGKCSSPELPSLS